MERERRKQEIIRGRRESENLAVPLSKTCFHVRIRRWERKRLEEQGLEGRGKGRWARVSLSPELNEESAVGSVI